MAKRSLKDLKAQLSKTSGGNKTSGGFYYPTWNLPYDGEVRFRILEDSDQDNPLIIYREYFEHQLHFGEKKQNIPCLKNNGKNTPCPICELSAKLYDADNKTKGKYYYRDASVILRGIIIEDGLEYEDGEENSVGKVRPFKLSYQIANKLKAEIGKLDDEDETFWDLDDGLDFTIVKSKNLTEKGVVPKYDLASGFVRKSTSIPAEYRKGIPADPLSALVPQIPTYEEAEELLSKHLRSMSGADDDADDAPTTQESEDDLMSKLNRNRASDKADKPKASTTKPAKVVEDDDPPFDVDEDVTVFDNAADDDDDDIDLTALLGDDD